MLIAIITLSVILADILTKYLVVQLLLPLGRSVTIIPHVLDFTYVENRGMAFGLFADNRWVFMIASVVLLVAIILIIRFSEVNHPMFLTSLSLILGGGIGNMLDRVFVGYVVDFIEATFIDFPVFNIADCCVVIGAILLAVYLIFFDKSFFAKRDGDKK